jgi:hypothetical protein
VGALGECVVQNRADTLLKGVSAARLFKGVKPGQGPDDRSRELLSRVMRGKSGCGVLPRFGS